MPEMQFHLDCNAGRRLRFPSRQVAGVVFCHGRHLSRLHGAVLSRDTMAEGFSEEMNSTIPLTPCQKCGSDAILHEQLALPQLGIGSLFWVQCTVCSAKCEPALTWAEAVEKWGRKRGK